MEISVYTDGSATKSGAKPNRLGIGAVCVHKEHEYVISKTITPGMFEYYGIRDYSQCSNPTAELLAVAEVLRSLSLVAFTAHHKITFYVDYLGVEMWILGKWKANKLYIKLLVDYCKKTMADMKCEVSFVHVKGHSGVKLNERADVLAGRALGVNTFSDFAL